MISQLQKELNSFFPLLRQSNADNYLHDSIIIGSLQEKAGQPSVSDALALHFPAWSQGLN